MNDSLRALLEFLEDGVDPDWQSEIRERHRLALDWSPVDRPPLVLTYPHPADERFQPFPHREVFHDMEKLLYNELLRGFDMSITCHRRVGDDLPYTIRANYGAGIVASIFGARIEQHDDNPPWVLGFNDEESFLSVLDRDPLDFTEGLCPKVMDTYAYFQFILAEYPALRRSVAIVLPDLQGPFDNAELLRGSDIFLDLHEEPERTDRVMRLLARAQVGLARRLRPYLNEPVGGYAHQHGVMLKGNILIRDDTAIMVSKDMYDRQIAPHDAWVLDQMGGGAIHSCGNIDHLASVYLALPGNHSLDLGQPLMNDLDMVYRRASDHRVAVVRADVNEQDLRSGKAAARFPTGMVFRHEATSLDHARSIFDDFVAHSGGHSP